MTTTERQPRAPQPGQMASTHGATASGCVAARSAFAENGAERHSTKSPPGRRGDRDALPALLLPARALQEAVFREQVQAVCACVAVLRESHEPGEALALWLRSLTGYIATKRGLSSALIKALGKDSELFSSCSAQMKVAGSGLLAEAQQAGVVRKEVDIADLLRLVHAVVLAIEQAPADDGQRDRLLSVVLDGLRA